MKKEIKSSENGFLPNGWTPLHYAVWGGSLEKVKELLDRGADVNSIDVKEVAPLYIVAHTGNKEVAIALIEAGADVNVINREGKTPLHEVACGNKAISESLIFQGIFQDEIKKYEKAALDVASKDIKGIAEIFIKNGAEVNKKDKMGRTPLHDAVMHGNIEIAKLLIKSEASIEAKANDGDTPLHWAALYGDLEIVQLLLQSEAEVNVKSEHGWAPLHWAAYNGHAGIAQLLLAHGADIEAKSDDGNTSLDVAKNENAVGSHDEIIALLSK